MIHWINIKYIFFWLPPLEMNITQMIIDLCVMSILIYKIKFRTNNRNFQSIEMMICGEKKWTNIQWRFGFFFDNDKNFVCPLKDTYRGPKIKKSSKKNYKHHCVHDAIYQSITESMLKVIIFHHWNIQIVKFNNW